MKNPKDVFPIQLFTKIAAWVCAVSAFISLAYYSFDDEYLVGLISFVVGALSFGVLMTIAKIADNIDVIKHHHNEK